MPNIETHENRISPLKKAVAIIGITVTTAIGIPVADEYLVASIPINHEMYTPHEYGQLKVKMIERMKKKDTEPLTIAEFQTWAGVADREVKKRGYVDIPAKSETFLEEINKQIEK